jgi:hypothetical protein
MHHKFHITLPHHSRAVYRRALSGGHGYQFRTTYVHRVKLAVKIASAFVLMTTGTFGDIPSVPQDLPRLPSTYRVGSGQTAYHTETVAPANSYSL